jgi:hypothetical protein
MKMASPQTRILCNEDMQFLEEITAAVVEEVRVAPGVEIGGYGPNTTGGTLLRPGGRDCYPAFWIRDYALALEAGFFSLDEQKHALMLTAENQRDETWNLPSGSVVPPGSIADHINFGGKPIYFPGTIADYEGQGGERFGFLPSLDDGYFLIFMTTRYIHETQAPSILTEAVRGKPLLQRLEEGYAMPPSDPGTGLVHVTKENRGVSFGYVDIVTHTGSLLVCSVLKWRAAIELSDLFKTAGNEEKATHYRQDAERLKKAINATFPHESGFLLASTGMSAQPDVWGTAMAVYLGVLTPAHEQAACEALAKAYREGILAWRGNIRHVPATHDFSETSIWEKVIGPKNQYMNGAYWGTPTGWVAYAIAHVDPERASQLAREYIAELREGDFRKGPEFSSPWECMHPDEDYHQNGVYMTTVACPLAAFRRMRKDRQ